VCVCARARGARCGSAAEGAQFCLFEAADATLSTFRDVGSLFTTNHTLGQIDGDIVWINRSTTADMMECPDLFPLTGDVWVLLGSLYQTNQWWIGRLQGTPPRFVLTGSHGLLDYGQAYAARSGAAHAQSPRARRVSFAFTGWQAPTQPPGCGRTMLLPRELRVVPTGAAADGGAGVGGGGSMRLTVEPVAETSSLRVRGSGVGGAVPWSRAGAGPVPNGQQGVGGGSRGGGAPRPPPPAPPAPPLLRLAAGSQLELRVRCTGLRAAQGWSSSGGGGGGGGGVRVGVRTLVSPDGAQYTEVGYDHTRQSLYVDHTHCCASSDHPIVQVCPWTLCNPARAYA
jgi:hypothetical protein